MKYTCAREIRSSNLLLLLFFFFFIRSFYVGYRINFLQNIGNIEK